MSGTADSRSESSLNVGRSGTEQLQLHLVLGAEPPHLCNPAALALGALLRSQPVGARPGDG